MGVYKYKQSIVVRGDLNMPKGKMAAQVAHASMGAIFDHCVINTSRIDRVGDEDDSGKKDTVTVYHYAMSVPKSVHEWLSGHFVRVVLKCQGLDDLLKLEEVVKEKKKIPYKLITDNGTAFFNKPTVTCIAIGPWDAGIIDEMTKEFKLM